MSDPIDIPMDSDDHLVDPPIIDLLFQDPIRDSYVITFIPEDRVSRAEKEVVVIPSHGEDGRRIRLRLERLKDLLGHSVEKAFHRGGGDFGFYFPDGSLYELSQDSGSSETTQEIYVHLQDLGMIAQIAFIDQRMSQSQIA